MQVEKESASVASESDTLDHGDTISSQSPSDETDKDRSDSDDEGYELTVEEAKEILRSILALCEQQLHMKNIAEARNKAQGDAREAMLSVVPIVVAVAEEALSRRVEYQPSTHTRVTTAAATTSTSIHMSSRVGGDATTSIPSPKPLLLDFLEEAKYLVEADSSGLMKKDMKYLRALLSPP